MREEIDHFKIEKNKNNEILNDLKTTFKEAENEFKYYTEEHKLAYEQRLIL